jgi:DNA-binding NarL/FixJ family response regulator
MSTPRMTLQEASQARESAWFSPRLSRRQLEVLKGAAAGEQSAETARRLYLTLHTIRAHRRHILERLCARNMTNAVAIAYRSGVLKVEEASGKAVTPDGGSRWSA